MELAYIEEFNKTPVSDEAENKYKSTCFCLEKEGEEQGDEGYTREMGVCG